MNYGGVDKNIPLPSAPSISRSYADRRHLSILGRGNGSHGPYRAWSGEVVEEFGDPLGFRETRKTVVTGVIMLRAVWTSAARRDMRGLLLRGMRRKL